MEDPTLQQQVPTATVSEGGGTGGTATPAQLDTPSSQGATGGPPPPPSPLSGCYLLIVIGEPHSPEHKEIILQRIAKGFLSWDSETSHVDLEKELQALTSQAPEGEEARNGERLIQYATENLVTEVLIHPQVNTLLQCIRNLLSSFTRHRHLIHAGYTFAGNGSWILQDGTFSLADLIDAFLEPEVQRVLRAYENCVTVDIHCSPEGDWTTERLAKESFARSCKVRVNPDDRLTAGSTPICNFINYINPFVRPASLEQLLEPSDVVGNIRFSHPTLYVFPGGQGDAALFGINGFNMLVDGGFARKACFWDFARHLDRLDAVLMTRLNNGTVNGLAAVLRRKKQTHVYPQIGHFFCNLQERRHVTSPDGDKDRDALLVNLLDEGQEIVLNLRHLQLRPHACYRDGNHVEPINLYHKVGHGKLDMYVISPAKDSRDVKEFLSKWNANDSRLFASSSRGREFHFPLQNLVSICALLVWQPANPNDTITRILFPGSTPQHKIFEGVDKLRNIEFLKHPVCTARSISPSASTVGLTGRGSAGGKQRQVPTVIDKLLPGEGVKTPSHPISNKQAPSAKTTATIPVAGSVPESKPQVKQQQPPATTTTAAALTSAPVSTPPSKAALSQTKQKVDKLTSKAEPPKMKTETNKIVDAEKPSAKAEKATKTIVSETVKSKVEHRSKIESRTSVIKSRTDSKPPRSTERRQKASPSATASEKKSESAKSSPTTPKKSVDSKINGVISRTEAAKATAPRTSSKTRPSPTATPAKSTKEANNRKVVESKYHARASSSSRQVTASRQETTVSKAERKPISRRPKPASPSKAATTAAKPPSSPAKSSSAKSTPTPSVKSDKDGVVRKHKGEAEKIATDSSAVSTPSTVEPETALKAKAQIEEAPPPAVEDKDKEIKEKVTQKIEAVPLQKEIETEVVKEEEKEVITKELKEVPEKIDEMIKEVSEETKLEREKTQKKPEEVSTAELTKDQEEGGDEEEEFTEDKESEIAIEETQEELLLTTEREAEATEEEVEEEEEEEEVGLAIGEKKTLAEELELEAAKEREKVKEGDEEEEEDEYLIIEKEEVEQYMEDSLQEQESAESHIPDTKEEDEEQKHLRDEVESEKEKKEKEDEEIKVNGYHEPGEREIEEEEKEEHIPSEKIEIKAKEPADSEKEAIALEEKEDIMDVKEEKLKQVSTEAVVPKEGTIQPEETKPEQKLTPATKEQIQEEVQEIITSAKEIVTKTKRESETKSEDVDEAIQKTTKEITESEQKKEAKEQDEGKEASSISPEEKLDISSEKVREPTEEQEKVVDQRYPAEESQPDERFSTTVESAATTAPTLPEDERIPLDEIKEIVEEKYVKEETKEEKRQPPHSAPAAVAPSVVPPQVIVPVVGGLFDPQAIVHLQRDIVKTPDEVADLPVHEEVDPGTYESEDFGKQLQSPEVEVKDTEEQQLGKGEVKKKEELLKEGAKEEKDVAPLLEPQKGEVEMPQKVQEEIKELPSDKLPIQTAAVTDTLPKKKVTEDLTKEEIPSDVEKHKSPVHEEQIIKPSDTTEEIEKLEKGIKDSQEPKEFSEEVQGLEDDVVMQQATEATSVMEEGYIVEEEIKNITKHFIEKEKVLTVAEVHVDDKTVIKPEITQHIQEEIQIEKTDEDELSIDKIEDNKTDMQTQKPCESATVSTEKQKTEMELIEQKVSEVKESQLEQESESESDSEKVEHKIFETVEEREIGEKMNREEREVGEKMYKEKQEVREKMYKEEREAGEKMYQEEREVREKMDKEEREVGEKMYKEEREVREKMYKEKGEVGEKMDKEKKEGEKEVITEIEAVETEVEKMDKEKPVKEDISDDESHKAFKEFKPQLPVKDTKVASEELEPSSAHREFELKEEYQTEISLSKEGKKEEDKDIDEKDKPGDEPLTKDEKDAKEFGIPKVEEKYAVPKDFKEAIPELQTEKVLGTEDTAAQPTPSPLSATYLEIIEKLQQDSKLTESSSAFEEEKVKDFTKEEVLKKTEIETATMYDIEQKSEELISPKSKVHIQELKDSTQAPVSEVEPEIPTKPSDKTTEAKEHLIQEKFDELKEKETIKTAAEKDSEKLSEGMPLGGEKKSSDDIKDSDKKAKVKDLTLPEDLTLAGEEKEDSYAEGSISPGEAYIDSGLEEEPVYVKMEAPELPEYVTVTPDSAPPSPQLLPKVQKEQEKDYKKLEGTEEVPSILEPKETPYTEILKAEIPVPPPTPMQKEPEDISTSKMTDLNEVRVLEGLISTSKTAIAETETKLSMQVEEILTTPRKEKDISRAMEEVTMKHIESTEPKDDTIMPISEDIKQMEISKLTSSETARDDETISKGVKDSATAVHDKESLQPTIMTAETEEQYKSEKDKLEQMTVSERETKEIASKEKIVTMLEDTTVDSLKTKSTKETLSTVEHSTTNGILDYEDDETHDDDLKIIKEIKTTTKTIVRDVDAIESDQQKQRVVSAAEEAGKDSRIITGVIDHEDETHTDRKMITTTTTTTTKKIVTGIDEKEIDDRKQVEEHITEELEKDVEGTTTVMEHKDYETDIEGRKLTRTTTTTTTTERTVTDVDGEETYDQKQLKGHAAEEAQQDSKVTTRVTEEDHDGKKLMRTTTTTTTTERTVTGVDGEETDAQKQLKEHAVEEAEQDGQVLEEDHETDVDGRKVIRTTTTTTTSKRVVTDFDGEEIDDQIQAEKLQEIEKDDKTITRLMDHEDGETDIEARKLIRTTTTTTTTKRMVAGADEEKTDDYAQVEEIVSKEIEKDGQVITRYMVNEEDETDSEGIKLITATTTTSTKKIVTGVDEKEVIDQRQVEEHAAVETEKDGKVTTTVLEHEGDETDSEGRKLITTTTTTTTTKKIVTGVDEKEVVDQKQVEEHAGEETERDDKVTTTVTEHEGDETDSEGRKLIRTTTTTTTTKKILTGVDEDKMDDEKRVDEHVTKEVEKDGKIISQVMEYQDDESDVEGRKLIKTTTTTTTTRRVVTGVDEEETDDQKRVEDHTAEDGKVTTTVMEHDDDEIDAEGRKLIRTTTTTTTKRVVTGVVEEGIDDQMQLKEYADEEIEKDGKVITRVMVDEEDETDSEGRKLIKTTTTTTTKQIVTGVDEEETDVQKVVGGHADEDVEKDSKVMEHESDETDAESRKLIRTTTTTTTTKRILTGITAEEIDHQKQLDEHAAKEAEKDDKVTTRVVQYEDGETDAEGRHLIRTTTTTTTTKLISGVHGEEIDDQKQLEKHSIEEAEEDGKITARIMEHEDGEADTEGRKLIKTTTTTTTRRVVAGVDEEEIEEQVKERPAEEIERDGKVTTTVMEHEGDETDSEGRKLIRTTTTTTTTKRLVTDIDGEGTDDLKPVEEHVGEETDKHSKVIIMGTDQENEEIDSEGRKIIKTIKTTTTRRFVSEVDDHQKIEKHITQESEDVGIIGHADEEVRDTDGKKITKTVITTIDSGTESVEKAQMEAHTTQQVDKDDSMNLEDEEVDADGKKVIRTTKTTRTTTRILSEFDTDDIDDSEQIEEHTTQEVGEDGRIITRIIKTRKIVSVSQEEEESEDSDFEEEYAESAVAEDGSEVDKISKTMSSHGTPIKSKDEIAQRESTPEDTVAKSTTTVTTVSSVKDAMGVETVTTITTKEITLDDGSVVKTTTQDISYGKDEDLRSDSAGSGKPLDILSLKSEESRPGSVDFSKPIEIIKMEDSRPASTDSSKPLDTISLKLDDSRPGSADIMKPLDGLKLQDSRPASADFGQPLDILKLTDSRPASADISKPTDILKLTDSRPASADIDKSMTELKSEDSRSGSSDSAKAAEAARAQLTSVKISDSKVPDRVDSAAKKLSDASLPAEAHATVEEKFDASRPESSDSGKPSEVLSKESEESRPCSVDSSKSVDILKVRESKEFDDGEGKKLESKLCSTESAKTDTQEKKSELDSVGFPEATGTLKDLDSTTTEEKKTKVLAEVSSDSVSASADISKIAVEDITSYVLEQKPEGSRPSSADVSKSIGSSVSSKPEDAISQKSGDSRAPSAELTATIEMLKTEESRPSSTDSSKQQETPYMKGSSPTPVGSSDIIKPAESAKPGDGISSYEESSKKAYVELEASKQAPKAKVPESVDVTEAFKMDDKKPETVDTMKLEGPPLTSADVTKGMETAEDSTHEFTKSISIKSSDKTLENGKLCIKSTQLEKSESSRPESADSNKSVDALSTKSEDSRSGSEMSMHDAELKKLKDQEEQKLSIKVSTSKLEELSASYDDSSKRTGVDTTRESHYSSARDASQKEDAKESSETDATALISSQSVPEHQISYSVTTTVVTTERKDGHDITTTTTTTTVTTEDDDKTQDEIPSLSKGSEMQEGSEIQLRREIASVPGQWEGGTRHHLYSDEEDEEELGSPLSVTSQMAHSPPSDFDFELGSKHKESHFSSSSMTSSFYGTLPPEPLSSASMMSSSFVADQENQFDYRHKHSSKDVMTSSFYGSIEEDKTKRGTEDTVDFERAMREHRSARGEDLTTSHYESSSSSYGITKSIAAINGQKYSTHESYSDGKGKSSGIEKETIFHTVHDQSSQKLRNGQSETSSTAHSIISSVTGSKGGITTQVVTHHLSEGIPEPPHSFAGPAESQDKKPHKEDPIKDWGEPLGLPAPAPPPPSTNNTTIGEVVAPKSGGTPKKEKKSIQMKKTMIMNENNKQKDGKSKRPESPVKQPGGGKGGGSNKETVRKSSGNPIYIDLTYVPHHGNSYYTSLEFFKKVRARYYVFSGTEPSREVYNALLEAKQTWEDKDLEVTIIPTYDTDTLGYWVAENEDALAKCKIDLSPSASRCTINLQDHETSCSAYRLEF